MGIWSRLFRRRRGEERGSTQDYLDMILWAQENGLVRTTMPTLTEEQVVGSFAPQVTSNGPIWSLMLARQQVFSQARFQFTRFKAGEPGELFGSPELRILETPWPGGTTADLLARMEMDVTCAGNSYWRRLTRLRFGEDRLVRLRPDWVTVIMASREDEQHPAEAADVELFGYMYAPRGDASRAIFLGPDEVAHYAPYPDPDATYLGMSWVTPVLRDILGDNLMTDHKRAFLRNAATPNLAIRFDPTVTLEQVKAFKKLLEEEHQGAENAWKTMYLGGGADPIPIGKDFKELDFSATQGKAESRLASAAGVPPSWVGFSEGLQGSSLNAGNFTAARRRFGDATMQHLWANAANSLQSLVRPPDAQAGLWFVTRGIPFLHMDASDEAAVQSQEAQTIAALIRDGFTAESVVTAVSNHDWSLLVHSGLTSVQLQPPGSGTNANGQPAAALPGGSSA